MSEFPPKGAVMKEGLCTPMCNEPMIVINGETRENDAGAAPPTISLLW